MKHADDLDPILVTEIEDEEHRETADRPLSDSLEARMRSCDGRSGTGIVGDPFDGLEEGIDEPHRRAGLSSRDECCVILDSRTRRGADAHGRFMRRHPGDSLVYLLIGLPARAARVSIAHPGVGRDRN